ncbi:MAG: extracellular solute-binding protein [Chloroflexota bacterium]|nr:extracellular solute-binding protein [Chloroflexota bacterium]
MARQDLSILSRLGRAVLSLALLVVSLSACTSWESEPGEPITLTFACQRSEINVYQDAAETFHQANPSIEIRVIPLDGMISFPLEDEMDTLGPVRQLASHTDAFIWTTDAVEGGLPGLVLDLSSFIEANGEPSEADFLSGLPAHFQWQGGTWGLPAGVEPLVVLYNPVAFEAAGLVPPAPGWAWDDLFDAGQQLMQREGEQVVRYGLADFGLGSVRSAVEAQGGRLVDDSADPPVPTLDDPRTVAAVEWYTDLVTQGVMANPASERVADAFDVVRRGEVAMSVNPAQLWVDGARDDELAVVPLPGRSPVWLYGYFVSAGTAHPEAAWRWLQFLSREIAPPDRLPARRSLISNSVYSTAAGKEALETLRYAAAHALPSVHPAAVEVLLRQTVERVFEGEEAENALAKAQEQALALPTPGVAEPFAVPSPAPAEAAMETITFVTFLYQEYTALAQAFHEAHPDIKVIVREADDFDYPGGPPAEMLEASGADCFRSTGVALMTPEIRQAVLNLQPFVDADSAFPLDDYLPWALERARYDGDLWRLPAGVSVDVLWYNHTLLDEASLPYPEGDWSWDDVFLTARRLTGGEEGDQRYGFIIWPDIYGLSLLEAIGGSLVDESAVLPTFRFDAPEVVAAARQLAELVRDEGAPMPRGAEERDGQDLFDLIWGDRVGMWIAPARGFDNQDDFYPAPLPQPGRCLGFRSSSAYYIAADTPHAEACWEWLRFLSERIPNTEHLPPRRSLLTSDAFRKQVGADIQGVYLEALECEEGGWLRGLESLPPYSSRAVYTWLEQALGEILWHGADAQAALSQAQRKAEAYLDCLRQRPDSENEASAEACFQQVDAP